MIDLDHTRLYPDRDERPENKQSQEQLLHMHPQVNLRLSE